MHHLKTPAPPTPSVPYLSSTPGKPCENNLNPVGWSTTVEPFDKVLQGANA